MRIDGITYRKVVNTGGRVMYVPVTDEEKHSERVGLIALIPVMTVMMLICFLAWWVTV